MRIAILKETKSPPDRRVSLIPEQVKRLKKLYPQHSWVVQSSPIRAYSNEEYSNVGVTIVEGVKDCDILLGVKEVEKECLIAGKTYLFFSHTAKFQEYNQALLEKLAALGNTIIDYEYLVKSSVRVVAFGYWAGVVGAYNALLGYGLKTKAYTLKPAHACVNLQELKRELKKVVFSKAIRIVLTGEGRVASGAIEMLEHANLQKQSSEDYLKQPHEENVYCQIGPQHYTKHSDGKTFDFNTFVKHPDVYESRFIPYAKCSDMYIACHFWEEKSPVFFTKSQMRSSDFKIRLIADVSCDIQGPIPTTIRASSIESPFYGVDLLSGQEIAPFVEGQLSVMAVDNLPGELPRDASKDFGEKLIEHVIPALISDAKSEMIEHATILKKGELTEKFTYLKDFLSGKLLS